MRNALARVGKGAEMVVATIRTMVAQPTPDAIRHHVDADMLTAQFPAVTELLLDAKADLTAYADSQFRSKRVVRLLKNNGLRGSMGRVGSSGDNAAMQSFFSLLQKNVLNTRR